MTLLRGISIGLLLLDALIYAPMSWKASALWMTAALITCFWGRLQQ